MKKKMAVLGACIIGILLLLGVVWLLRVRLRPPVISEPEKPVERYGLSNPEADENTRCLMNYLFDIYGKQMLSGQFCHDYYGKTELTLLQDETGELPALVGFDFMYYSPSLIKNGGYSEAVRWAEEEAQDGAIITFCWHWNPPEQYLTGNGWEGYRTENTNIDLDAIMDGRDEAGYQLLLDDMDAIAWQLYSLQEKGIPVIWRPLHEASGGWFWWGNCRPESYIKLYRLMYKRFTEEWKLNNLIWLWNGMDPEWYPGNDVVDLIGEDIYGEPRNYTSYAEEFRQAQADYTDVNKLVVLSETGVMPDPEMAYSEGATWSFFMLWSGQHLFQGNDSQKLSEEYTSREMLRKAYASEYVITREELPEIYSDRKN